MCCETAPKSVRYQDQFSIFLYLLDYVMWVKKNKQKNTGDILDGLENGGWD